LSVGAVLDVLAIGIHSLVILLLAQVIFRHVIKVGRAVLSGVFQSKPRQGLVQSSEALGKMQDYFLGYLGILLDKPHVLILANRDQNDVGQGLGGFDMAVGRHCRNNAKEVSGVKLFFIAFHHCLFGDSYLSLLDDKKTTGVLLAFYNNILVFFKVYSFHRILLLLYQMFVKSNTPITEYFLRSRSGFSRHFSTAPSAKTPAAGGKSDPPPPDPPR